MKRPQIVIDTNVFVSALRSRQGASHRLVMLLGTNKFDVHLSVPLVIEYESIAKRLIGKRTGLNATDIDDVVDYFCSVGQRCEIHFLWRPFLADPNDDMVLELAVAAGCEIIVTYNKSDFKGISQFGIRALTAREFLQEIGEIP